MGMFDEVNFSMPCPECGAEVKTFQSKDGACELETVEPDAVDNFYASCRKCSAWIYFSRPRSLVPLRKEPLTVEQVTAMGFSMTVKPRLTKHAQDPDR